MLGLKVNKKLLQSHLSQKSGQVVLLKDLHNIASSSSSKAADMNGIEKIIEEIGKVSGMGPGLGSLN